MNNLNENFERILEVLRKISKERLLPYQRRQPKLSDLELVSLSLTAEFMGIDSENDLNTIRLKLASHFNEFEAYFVVDSMSLGVCKLS